MESGCTMDRLTSVSSLLNQWQSLVKERSLLGEDSCCRYAKDCLIRQLPVFSYSVSDGAHHCGYKIDVSPQNTSNLDGDKVELHEMSRYFGTPAVICSEGFIYALSSSAFIMISSPLLIALFIRSLSLLLPQTYFQPDEFFQALEPAHNLVFGFGHLTWEWRDLGSTQNTVAVNVLGIDDLGNGGMRGWLWPLVFAAVYKILYIANLDHTFLIVRIFC